MGDRIVRDYSTKAYLAKFGEESCPRCNSTKVKCYERTKGTLEYKVYVCEKCKVVLGREIK